MLVPGIQHSDLIFFIHFKIITMISLVMSQCKRYFVIIEMNYFLRIVFRSSNQVLSLRLTNTWFIGNSARSVLSRLFRVLGKRIGFECFIWAHTPGLTILGEVVQAGLPICGGLCSCQSKLVAWDPKHSGMWRFQRHFICLQKIKVFLKAWFFSMRLDVTILFLI